MLELLDHLPPRLRAPVRRVLTTIATSLWFAPLLAGTIAAVTALGLVTLDPFADAIPLKLEDQEAMRSALTSIISATIAATSLAVTGTIIALQLATGQYSPRLLRDVLTDGGVRWTLATYVGTVVYLLMVVGNTTENRLPKAAVAVGFLLGVVVIALLVFFVHHIVQRLRLETIIGDVTRRTLRTIEETHPADAEPDEAPEVPDDATGVPARRSGYVQAATVEALAIAAAHAGMHVRARLRVGDYLTRGTTAVWAWCDDGHDLPDVDELADAVDDSFVLGDDRTLDGDPAYGVRHLVDIGCRAVSPGINDPTTAVQCIHHATTVLVSLASRPLQHEVRWHDGHVAVLPKPDLAAILELAQAQLLQYGGGDPRVVDALATQLRDVVEAGTVPERRDLVRERLACLREDVERRDHSDASLALIERSLERVATLLDTDEADDEEGPAG